MKGGQKSKSNVVLPTLLSVAVPLLLFVKANETGGPFCCACAKVTTAAEAGAAIRADAMAVACPRGVIHLQC